MAQLAVTVGREEETFLGGPGFLVTSSRFIVGPQTYALSQITSVRYAPPDRAKAITTAVIGFGLAFVLPPVGILMLLVGVIWAFLVPAGVVIATAGGEVRALSNLNKKLIQSIVNALNNAIVSRG